MYESMEHFWCNNAGRKTGFLKEKMLFLDKNQIKRYRYIDLLLVHHGPGVVSTNDIHL